MAHQKQHLASDPPHAGGSLSAVLAHAHECAPRAPRHRPTIARRLETDLPLLTLACDLVGACVLRGAVMQLRGLASTAPCTTSLRPESRMAHQKQHLASDPPHAGVALAAVLAHAQECAPRAPRHRPTIARRLETDLPLLSLAWAASVARCGGARPGPRISPAALQSVEIPLQRRSPLRLGLLIALPHTVGPLLQCDRRPEAGPLSSVCLRQLLREPCLGALLEVERSVRRQSISEKRACLLRDGSWFSPRPQLQPGTPFYDVAA